jgi:hypothetical protein
MRNAIEARREIWLRRTRLATGWCAALAAVATLLIAAVAGSASTAKKVASPAPRVQPLRRTAVVRAPAATRRHVRLTVHVRARTVRHARHAHVHVHVAPAPVVQAPVPAHVVPVVVSGGS